MLNFNLSNGLDFVSAAGFVGYTVVFSPEHLCRVSGQLHLTELSDSMINGSSQWQSENTLAISGNLRALFYQALDQKDRPVAEFTGLINENLAMAIAAELGSKTTKFQTTQASYKARILKRALEILYDEDELPISVAELCLKAGASSSSLNRIFLSEYGLSPKAYIRARCLSAVLDVLSCAPPSSRISDIANKWGFWHMGQFARDFRKLFGELPSQYLAR